MSFTVNKNGYLNNPLSVELTGSWLKNGVGDFLPIDYHPDKADTGQIWAGSKERDLLDTHVSKYNEFSFKSSNQQLFLHLDKPYYASGDPIYFSSFLASYSSKKLIPGIYKMHVDLIAPDNSIIESAILPVLDGQAPGAFLNTKELPSGRYRIRAYTSEMLAFGKSYFFEQPVNIYNPKNFTSNRHAQETTDSSINMMFFPEGGNMINNLNGTVAFKAVDSQGNGLLVSGVIMDDKGKKVTDFEGNHLGMGSFRLKPEEGSVYTATVNHKGQTKRFPLPQALKQGYIMAVTNNQEDYLNVSVQNSSGLIDDYFFLVGQSREIVSYKFYGKTKKGKTEIRIPKHELPEGVFQLTLFDKEGLPRCERLVYVRNEFSDISVGVNMGKPDYGRREKVEIEISIHDIFEDPVAGVASVSVVDAAFLSSGSVGANIKMHLLLSSDLKGKIENPGYYFQTASVDVDKDLDLLMLTQGWRRYNWNEILKPDFKLPENPVEKGLAVNGTVLRHKRPVPFAQIILIPQSNVWAPYVIAKANREGKFSIPDVEVFDTTKVYVNILDVKGQYIDAYLEFDRFLPPAADRLKLTETFADHNPLIQSFLKRSEQAQKIDSIYNPEGVIVLEEVEIAGKKIKEEQVRDIAVLHGDADIVFDNFGDRFAGYASLQDALKGRFRMQGSGNFSTENDGVDEPLYLLDGVYINKDDLQTISVQEVERVEIVKEGAAAGIYGVRAGNGVVAIYMKKRVNQNDSPNKGTGVYTLPAYNVAKEFYMPSYAGEDDEFIKPDFRTTLYWNPLIAFDAEGKSQITFYNTDDTKKFQVVIQGISTEGVPFFRIWNSGEEQ